MYPSPYLPPGVPQHYAAPDDPLRPAKRASLVMFIMGPLILLGGTCMMAVPAMLRAAPSPEVEQLRQKLQAQSHMNMDTLMFNTGAVAAVVGLTLLLTGFFVRRGGKQSSIFAFATVFLTDAYLITNMLGCLVLGNVPAACMSALMVGLFSVLLVWLFQAIRASKNVALAQQQYAAQYWQYQQAMQAYAVSGYGYNQGQVPPPIPSQQPPPIVPQPPPPPASE